MGSSGSKPPSEVNGVNCHHCGKRLPPCTKHENYTRKVIDRIVDKKEWFSFNGGQYYRPCIHELIYHCPTCFWKPRDDYKRKQAEKKQQKKREQQRREEERKKKQQEQEALEENLKVTRKKKAQKHVRAQTYRNVAAMPHDDAQIDYEELLEENYELWLEEDLQIDECHKDEKELDEKEVIQKVITMVLNYNPKQNEKIDVPWLKIAQTQLTCNYASLHGLLGMEVEVLTYCVSQVRNKLTDKEILILTKLLCLVAKTHPLEYRKTPTTLDDELPGRFMIMLLQTASENGYSKTECANQCVRILAANTIKDEELVSMISQFQSKLWSAYDRFAFLKRCNELNMPFTDQKKIMTMVQAYDISPSTLEEKMKNDNVGEVMTALNDYVNNEPNTPLTELLKEIRSTQLIDDEILDRVSPIVQETKRHFEGRRPMNRASQLMELRMAKDAFMSKEDEFPYYRHRPTSRRNRYMGAGSFMNPYDDMYRNKDFSFGEHGYELGYAVDEDFGYGRYSGDMYGENFGYGGFGMGSSYFERPDYRSGMSPYHMYLDEDESAPFMYPESRFDDNDDNDTYRLSSYEKKLCGGLAALCHAVKTSKGYFPRDTQLITLTILILSGNKSISRVLEVMTGEGKSTIIAMFAAFLALRGKHVDIITSSPILAVRDAEEWSSFYDILDLKATHNTDVDQKKHKDPDKHRKEVYKTPIVYGTVNNFAADILRDEFEQKDIRSDRRFDAVIADEVDLLMLDEGVQFTYLSHDSPILYHLQPLIATVWAVIGQHLPITTATGHAYYMGGAKLFSDVIFESIDPEFCGIEDSSQLLVIANEKGLISGEIADQLMFDDEKSKQGEVSASKKEAMSAISNTTITALLPILEEYLPYNFEAYSVNDKGLPLLHYTTEVAKTELPEDERLPVVRLLLLDNGLACMLNSKQELMEGTTAKIEASIEFSDDGGKDDEPKIKLPSFLKDFVLAQLPEYINSAFRCLEMVENREYTISSEKKMIPVDFLNSGVMQLNKKWGQGLQQMLEMKHKLCVSSMSLVTNFMSHVELFTRYKTHGRIYGLTGTLGIDSQDTSTLLKELFEVHPCTIPTFRHKKLKENPAIIIEGSKQDWYAKVMDVINVAVETKPWCKGRAVLVLCEDIKTAVDMREYVLSQKNWTKDKVHLYARSDSKELNAIKRKFSAGEVVIATNLAGRGTNIKVTDEVNKSGGLLCLLTFLPRNRRVELQAFGRTARKGKPGSVQCILHASSLAPRYRGRDITTIRQIRARNEQKRLEILLKSDVKEVQVKESLFKAHCKYLKEMFKRLEGRNDRPITIDAINENWGQWLLMVAKDIESLQEQKLSNELATVQSTWPATNFYHKIKYSNNLLVLDQEKNAHQAYEMLTEGIMMESTYKAISYYNRAYVSILRSSSDSHDAAWAELRDALDYLNAYIGEVATVLQCVSAVHKVQSRSTTEGEDENVATDLFSQQMQARLQIWKFFRDNINKGMDKIQKFKDSGDDIEAEAMGIFSLIPDADYTTNMELYALWNLGMEIVFDVKKKPKFCWDALLVFFLGIAQIVAGIALAVLTVGAAANFGMALISEGISDCIDGVVGMATGAFSWAEWAITKAISIAMSLVTGGIAKFATKGLKAIKLATKAGKTLKAVPKVTKGSWKVATKANFKSVMKTVGKDVAEQTIMTGVSYGQDAVLEKIYDTIGEECKKSILPDLKTSFTQGYLGEVVQIRFAHKLAGSYVADDRMSPATKQEANKFFSEVGVEVFNSLLQDPTIQNLVKDAASGILGEMADSHKGRTRIAFKTLEVASQGAIVAKAVYDIKIILDKLVDETEKTCKEFVEEEGEATNEDVTRNSHLSCIEALKNELANHMGNVYSDILSASLQQNFGGSVNKQVRSGLSGVEDGYLKQIKPSSETEAAIKAQLAINNSRSIDSSSDDSPLPPVAHLMMKKYCSEVEDVTKAGSLLEMKIAVEHFKQGITVYVKEDGEFLKHSSIDPTSGDGAKPNIQLLFIPPQDKDGTESYDLMVNGTIVKVHSEDSNHLFQAYAAGRNPELVDSTQGLEQLSKDACDVRKAIVEEVNNNPLFWAEHVTQSLELDQIRQGERFELLNEGRKNNKTRVPPNTYTEILNGTERHTLYSSLNGVTVEAVRTHGKELDTNANGYLMSKDGTRETRLHSLVITLQKMNFGKNVGRCYHTLPVSGMPDCVGGQTANLCVLFQLGPGKAGGNAGNAYANAVMASRDYERKGQQEIWTSEVRSKLGNDDFTVKCDVEFESLIPDGSFSEFFGELNALRSNHGKQLIHQTNENALKERLQAMHDIDSRAARVVKLTYTITCGTFVHNVSLGRDLEIFVPESFTEPNQSYEAPGENLSTSRSKVKKDRFNSVPGQVAAKAGKALKEQHDKHVEEYKKTHGL